MKLVLLGTGGYHPSASRHTACLMLPEVGLVLDAGTAMFRVRDYVCTTRLDIVLSHAHLDHVVGLTYLLDILEGRNVESVNVYAAPEKLAALERHLFAEAIFPVRPPCTFHPLEPEINLAGGCRLRSFPLPHPGGSMGFRVDRGARSFAYVTDTTARDDADYVGYLRGVDVLVHECYFPDSKSELASVTGHSCLSAVARLAQAAGVGRLILVHMDPLLAADAPLDLRLARQIFARTDIGRDLMEVEF